MKEKTGKGLKALCQVMRGMCHGVPDGMGMLSEQALGLNGHCCAHNCQRAGDIMNCSCHRATKLLGHGTNGVEMKLLVKQETP